MRRVLKQLLLAGLASVVGLLFIEGALRIREGRAPPAREYVAPANMHRADPELGYALSAGVSVTLEREDFSILVVTNSLGFRDRELGPKVPGTWRILSLGDSYAFGYGVEVRDTYADRLERLLNGESGGVPRFDVVNAGVNGYGTYQQLRQLQRHGRAIDPDLVTLSFFTGNDFQNNLVTTGQYEKDFDRGLGGWLVASSRFFALMAPRIKNAELKTLTEEGFEATMEGMRLLQQECEKLGAPLAVMMITPSPVEFEKYYSRAPLRLSLDRALGFDPRARLERFAAETREMGIPVLDMLALLEGMDLGEELVLPVSGHWSVLGHRIAAEALRDFLIEEKLVPLRGTS